MKQVSFGNEHFVRGVAYILAGIVLLLHTLELITVGLNILLILISLGMITYGMKESNALEIFATLLRRTKKAVHTVNNDSQTTKKNTPQSTKKRTRTK